VAVHAECEVRIDARMEPHWCHTRVRCGDEGGDLVDAWMECTLGEGRSSSAIQGHADQVDVDTATHRANVRGIQITLE